MEIRLRQIHSFRQKGNRENQEDSRFPNLDIINKEQRFFVVCDGVGGCENGEIASAAVCESIGKTLGKTNLGETIVDTKLMTTIIDNAYDALDKKHKATDDKATTMTFVCFHRNGMVMAHIGDSRIYQFRPKSGIVFRSDDHSLVNSMVHSGQIAPDSAESHPQKNVITRYMSAVADDESRCMATVTFSKDIESGDYLFLCTDGVLSCMSDEDLIDTICKSEEDDATKMSRIAELCRNSDDNNTAILIPVDFVGRTDQEQLPDIQNVNDTIRLNRSLQTTIEMESNKKLKSTTFFNLIKGMFSK